MSGLTAGNENWMGIGGMRASASGALRVALQRMELIFFDLERHLRVSSISTEFKMFQCLQSCFVTAELLCLRSFSLWHR